MQASFWHDRWESNQIGFHLPEPHPLLKRAIKATNAVHKGVVFVPLCGKSLDIMHLLDNGFEVVAVELSELAVQQLFKEMDAEPVISAHGNLKRYQTEQLTVYVGDIFELTQADLGAVDAVYDRAALVALPSKMREAYVQHVPNITGNAPQWLITIDYDQSVMDGPPFAIGPDMVQMYYQSSFLCKVIETMQIEGGLKGKTPAAETLWHLTGAD